MPDKASAYADNCALVTAPTPTPGGDRHADACTNRADPAVHDPAIIKDANTYFMFATGAMSDREGLLATRTSTDLSAWAYRGAAYTALPSWATTTVPGASGIWPPYVVKRNGQFRLYYSIATFGRNNSAIGMTTSNALNSNTPASGWTDRGVVIQSSSSDDFNAIDPVVFTDAEEREWMAFGSFWTGIKLVQLDPAPGCPMRSAARSTRSPGVRHPARSRRRS